MTGESAAARGAGRGTALVVAGLFAALDLLFLRWVLVHAGYWGFWDWDYQQALLEVARRSIVEHGQIPLWNPYIGGGTTLAGDSLGHTFGPCFLPVLLLGTLPGVKVCLLAYLLVAQAGTYALARNHGIGILGACLAAVLYSLGGAYAQHLAHGHFEWIALAWFPWATLFVERAAERLGARTIALGALVVACCVLDGGPYQFVFVSVFLAVYAVFLAVAHRSLRPLLGLALILGLGAGLAAVKLVPVLETAWRFPRRIPEDRFYGAPFRPTALQSVYQAFLSRDQLHRPDVWMPYVLNVGCYVGWIPLALALAGAAAGLRRHGPLVATGLFFLWTSLGTSIEATPWAILHRLPGLAMLRVPSRFTIFVLLVLAVLAGAGLQAVQRVAASRLARTRAAAVVPLALVAIVAGDLVWLNGEVFKVAFSIPPLAVAPAGRFRSYLHSPYLAEYRRRALYATFPNWPSAAYPAVLENRGVLDNYRTIPFRTYAVPEGHPAFHGYVWTPDPDAAIVAFDLSPNRIRIVTDGRARTVVVDQNHDPGWKAAGDPGGRVEASNGLLAVSLPPGQREVELVYAPDAFRRGALTSLGALVVLGLLLALGTSRLPALWVDRGKRS